MSPAFQRPTAVHSPRRTSGSRAAWLAVLFTLLAAGLRLYRLGHKSIWWDEGFSVFLARLPLGEMLTATAHDTHPPVYYALLSLWRLAAGDAEVAVRLPSVLAGVLLAPLAYRLVRPLAGKRAAVAAAALVALNRLLIWYSQEVRQYALAACLALASALLATALWRRRRWTLWAAYVVVNLAGLLTLYLFSSVLLAQNAAFVVALWRAPDKRRLALTWFSAQAAVALACLPWVDYYLPRAPHFFVPPGTLGLLGVLKLYLATLFAGDPSNIDRFWLLSLAGGLALAFALLLAVRLGRRTPRAGFTALLLLAGAALPPALVWLLNLPLGLGLTFVPNPRYFVVLAPWSLCALAVAAGWALRPTTARAGRWIGQLALAGLAVAGLGLAAQYYRDRVLTDDFVSAAATLAAYRQPDDALVLDNDQNWPVAAYHLGGRDWLGLNSGRTIATPAGAAEAVEEAWNTHAGLWLLLTPEALMSDPDRQVYAWLAARAQAIRAYPNEPGCQLFFFARTPERAAAAGTLADPAGPPPTLSFAPAPGLTLVRAEWVLPEYRQGDTLRLFLYWHNAQAVGAYPYAVLLNTMMGQPAERVAGLLEITAASPAVVRQQVDFPVRAYVGAGMYRLDLVAGAAQARLGLVTVLAAQAHGAVDTQPETAAQIQFEQGIQLLGYTARAAAGQLDFIPYWNTRAPVDTRYKLYAHVFGDTVNPATGTRLWGQVDREPNFGLTPVTAWRVGETIADRLTFDLPPGTYTLALGWYDAFTGQHLLVLDPSGQPLASEATLGPFTIPPPAD